MASELARAPQHIDTAETAKHVRAALKARFPAHKFSVRISRYSMGSSVRVHWTDGPTVGLVESVIDRFQGKGYDGTDDSSYCIVSELDGQPVIFGGSLSCSRSRSAAFLARVYAEVCQRFGFTPLAGAIKSGTYASVEDPRHLNGWSGDGLAEWVYRFSENRVYDAGSFDHQTWTADPPVPAPAPEPTPARHLWVMA